MIESGRCLADTDRDHDVDGTDLPLLVHDYNRTDCSEASPCSGDINGDGIVNADDLYIFASEFGNTSCPDDKFFYFHNDHLGTPQRITDQNGTMVWSANYKPFGEATITLDTISNPFRFPGQYYDAETGLHYNYYRYYHPEIGRYLRADPVGLDGGINLYLYANANPIIFTDSIGLWSIGGGAYAGFGGDISYSSTTCCKNAKKQHVRFITFCAGVGAGGRLAGRSAPVAGQFGSVGASTYGNTCPKTGDMFVAQQATLALGVGATGTAQAGNSGFGVEATGTIGLGGSLEALKACAIIVVDEFSYGADCCESGERLTDTPLQ